MKGIALADRDNPKDAWDIDFCVRFYPNGQEAREGLEKLVEEFKPHVGHALVREGLSRIAEEFSGPISRGPRMVADFEDLLPGEDRERRQRDAYERVAFVVRQLGIV